MKAKDIKSLATGALRSSSDAFWERRDTERDAARRLITYLEDRRVLYGPRHLEDQQYCVESVLGIRAFLTNELQAIESQSGFSKMLRAMRSSCRKFLDTLADNNHAGYPEFLIALGELRGVFGIHIANLAARYGLDVEDDLASILPVKDDTKGT